MSENCETTQKYESFAWLTVIEPAPIAMITSTLPISDVKPRAGMSGATIAEVKIIATVDAPIADFKIAAVRKVWIFYFLLKSVDCIYEIIYTSISVGY